MTARVAEEKKEHNAIDDLHLYLKDELESVNETILRHMQSDVALIPTLASHIIASGGKRLRPLLTLLVGKLFKHQGVRHVNLAACVEFIHTATLLHDDVVDESLLRRGKKTANSLWGNKASVLVGDFLFSRSFELMVADGDLNVLDCLSKASARIAQGEVQQLMTTNDLETTIADYYSVIEAKTACLFEAACQVGALIENAQQSHIDALKTYGLNLGIAFQLVDDMLDYAADQALLGKNLGDDFREGKMTLPLIYLIEKTKQTHNDFWQRTIVEHNQKDDDFETVLKLVKEYNILEIVQKQVAHHIERAQMSLAPFQGSKEYDLLIDVADFCLHREH